MVIDCDTSSSSPIAAQSSHNEQITMAANSKNQSLREMELLDQLQVLQLQLEREEQDGARRQQRAHEDGERVHLKLLSELKNKLEVCIVVKFVHYSQVIYNLYDYLLLIFMYFFFRYIT